MRILKKLRKKLSCLSSYPELRMIGGKRRLKNRVCLNVCQKQSEPRLKEKEIETTQLTNISLIRVPGASRTISPTNIPAKIDMIVS